ncbi:Uma2 family endonuclease [Streptomyces sp. UNOB3_S3]|uniref:Uma2 family endonuclease n=1 Tax=Streptomyces sp. UNOB3_S3 TaxID=2871682 RepID=UPI001E3FEAF5|nr:Uma2 family endonuclease [Streptomyces sp. UNOB3_S3]MCC3777993.1 Uma2 family endonuclease [Streptomyces sp. UNOB3_S3]
MEYARVLAVAEELHRHAQDAAKRFEISGNSIIVTVSTPRRCDYNAFLLRRQLDRQLAEGWAAHNWGAVEDVAQGILRRPAVIVLPEAAMLRPTGIDPRDLALAADVIPPLGQLHDTQRMYDAAAMAVPLYVLVNPRNGTTAVMSDPTGVDDEGQRCYRSRAKHAFGDVITIGEWTVDTSEFRRYPTS